MKDIRILLPRTLHKERLNYSVIACNFNLNIIGYKMFPVGRHDTSIELSKNIRDTSTISGSLPSSLDIRTMCR